MKTPSKNKYRAGRKTRPLTLLPLGEVERLRQENAEDERYLNAVRGRGRVSDEDNAEAHLAPSQIGQGVDASAIEARIRRRSRALEAMSPHVHQFKGAERQRACVRIKENEEYVRRHMLSTREMGRYPKGDDHEAHQEYMRASQKSFEMEIGNPEFQRRAAQLKEDYRRLDPDNADLPNLERFRPVVRTGGRMRRY